MILFGARNLDSTFAELADILETYDSWSTAFADMLETVFLAPKSSPGYEKRLILASPITTGT